MDRVERIRLLRDKYEAALDEADRLRADYHREILKLHRSGMSLREIAEQLGISHQRVHQIVGGTETRPRRRAIGAATAIVLAIGLTAGLLTIHRSTRPPQESSPTVSSRTTPLLAIRCVVRDHNASAFKPFLLATVAAGACLEAVAVLDAKTGQILATIDPRAQGVAEDLLDDERSG